MSVGAMGPKGLADTLSTGATHFSVGLSCRCVDLDTRTHTSTQTLRPAPVMTVLVLGHKGTARCSFVCVGMYGDTVKTF